MDVTFIGIGLMGRPMAERLLAAGHTLTVYNRTRGKALPLGEQGARVAASAAEAVVASPVTVLMLADGPAVQAVLFEGEEPPDLTRRTVIQMSTLGAEESTAIAQRVEAAGGEYLEAPVLGSTPQASEGALLVMVGATEEQFDRWRQLLSTFGPEPRRLGGVGQAAAVKLAFNQLIASQAATFSLALGMVRRRGLDVEGFMEILRRSPLYTKSFDAKLPRMRQRDFSDPNFPLRLMLKDVDLALAEAGRLGLGTGALEGVRQVVARAVESGGGDGDYSGLYQAVDPAS